MEICQANGITQPLQRLTELALQQCVQFTGGVVDFEVILVDFDGRIVARAAQARSAAPLAPPDTRPLVERLAEGEADEDPE